MNPTRLSLALIVLSSLTACMTPGVNMITIEKDWIGPDPDGQFKACTHRGPRTGSSGKDIHWVSVNGKPYSVTTDSRSSMQSRVAATGEITAINKCMVKAGYVFYPATFTLIDAITACRYTPRSEQCQADKIAAVKAEALRKAGQ